MPEAYHDGLDTLEQLATEKFSLLGLEPGGGHLDDAECATQLAGVRARFARANATVLDSYAAAVIRYQIGADDVARARLEEWSAFLAGKDEEPGRAP